MKKKSEWQERVERKLRKGEPVIRPLARIQPDPQCRKCEGFGWVCENHRGKIWREVDGGCMCGAGAPCACNPMTIRIQKLTALGPLPGGPGGEKA